MLEMHIFGSLAYCSTESHRTKIKSLGEKVQRRKVGPGLSPGAFLYLEIGTKIGASKADQE